MAAVFNNANPLVIGGNYQGYIGEFRMTKGKAFHLMDFTVPYKPYSYKSYYEYQIDDTDREAARATVLPLPGEGPVLGCAVLDGDVFGVRDDLGGGTSTLYRSSALGWVAQTTCSYPPR